jgi:uncharacterized protein YcbK (DUF882 family)
LTRINRRELTKPIPPATASDTGKIAARVAAALRYNAHRVPSALNACRRRLLRTAFAVASPLFAVPLHTQAQGGAPRVLQFDHLHTGERLGVEYWSDGAYRPDALAAVNRLLRDFRTGTVGAIDTRLLDLLHALARLTGGRRPFEVISGFRSAETNEALRRNGGGGVARGSLHLEGRAIDIRIADVPLATLRDAALALRSGGVGHYPRSNFVHVDTGRVRRW